MLLSTGWSHIAGNRNPSTHRRNRGCIVQTVSGRHIFRVNVSGRSADTDSTRTQVEARDKTNADLVPGG